MTTVFMIFSAAAAVLVAVLLTAYGVTTLCMRRRRSRDTALEVSYLRIVMLAVADAGTVTPRFPQIDRSGARMRLVEVIAGVAEATYGLDLTPLRRIVTRYGLDAWLWEQILQARGWRRARLLALFGQLPGDDALKGRAAAYVRSGNRYVSFYALMTLLAADPAMALRRMAEYPRPFSASEVAEIVALLRRGMLPIAYEPLVASPSRNLRMVGMGIVRQFGIEEAEPLLLRVVRSDDSPHIAREALHTLCALKRPLAGRFVAARIASLDTSQRKSLLRAMAQEGYAPHELNRLFDRRERPYYESLVQSYKRSLA